MTLRKKKKEDGKWWGDLPVKDETTYTKEDLNDFHNQLKKGRYLGFNDEMGLEKELEWLRDQKIITLIKKKPNGTGKIINDFEILVKADACARYDEEANKIFHWKKYRWWIDNVRDKSIVDQINLTEKYAPDFYKKKKEDKERLSLKSIFNQSQPVKSEIKVPIDPKVLDISEIKL